jgi:hypothetical protein
MKLFWIGYTPLPLCFIIFFCPWIGNAAIETVFIVGVLLSVVVLVFNRRQIIDKKHQLLLGLLAGFSSIMVGFIIIIAMVLIVELIGNGDSL